MDDSKEHKSTLLANWLQEIENNPRFSGDQLKNNVNLTNYSKEFLSKLIEVSHNKNVKQLSKQMFEPLLELWHQINQDQVLRGFSTRDIAVLIYALKTSIIKDTKNYSEKNTQTVSELERVLDLLGMLIFEMYTLEKDKVINQQKEHINYLTKTPKLNSNIIGNSLSMKQVFKAIGLVLENDITVLLEGESGTGKDIIANSIHENSNRKNKPFIAINCGAIPKDLIESELFGHEKGAFTGADSTKIGKFELSDGGTLFLDEIGEMPLDLQVRLLRVLQNKYIERVGGNTSVPIDTRIIAATNKPLKTLVDEKKFRMDLYYRLNVYPIHIPALRNRTEDIIPLALLFIDRYNNQFLCKSGPLTKDAKSYLINQHWEGNVRELENTIQRAVLLAQSSPISSLILKLKPGETYTQLLIDTPNKTPNLFDENEIVPLEELEKKGIEHAIKVNNSNLKKVAESLKISRTTLYNKIEKYDIKVKKN
jgi:transcriptional regulator with GAF, ATPase, and Fis domain